MTAIVGKNAHEPTVQSFAREWSRFDQAAVSQEELSRMFDEYFAIFPWESLPNLARGADIGCGSGRWAKFVIERIGMLHLIDASQEALDVARKNLSGFENAFFHHASVEKLPFEDSSLDFGYSLGVLHHVPDPGAALASCARVLRPGAPFLVYLYYALDNRPRWYRFLFALSNTVRRIVASLPPRTKDVVCDAIATSIYWPLARAARLGEAIGLDVTDAPMTAYRNRSFYSMRTDARDRFGTPLEKRFTADQIATLMREAGFENVRIKAGPPYWCAVGVKGSGS
jgi:SAM-dependent methyltransferase